MAKPKAGESKDDFLGRCMSELQGEFPDQKQRYAACNSMWKESADDEELDDAEELDESNPRGINQYTKGIKAGTSVGPLRAGNLNKHAQAGRLRYKGKKVAKVLDAGSELSVYLHPGQGQARGAPYHVRPATAKREGSFSVSESEGGDALNEVDIADFIELNEVRFQRDGSVPVKVIQPGWGSSGFYSKELLESAAERFDGAQMYWNHPTPDEDKVRPERSLNDLAAILSNARYRESGPAGPGVYAFAKVFSPFKERIGELAPYIGVSILAQGRGAMGKADDKEGLIIESIDHVRSVDFVTKAGAGGRVVEMFEAAREPIVIIDESGKGGEEDMELKEALEELATIKTQLSEAEAKMAEQKDYLKTFQAISAGDMRIQFTPQPLFFETTTEWAQALQDIYAGQDAQERLDKLVESLTQQLKDAGIYQE